MKSALASAVRPVAVVVRAADNETRLVMRSGRRILGSGLAHTRALSVRAENWAERQDTASLRGVAVGSWRRYRAVDGPSQTAVLAYTVDGAIGSIASASTSLSEPDGAQMAVQ